MSDIITRLEAATEGSRELDAEIVATVVGWRPVDSPGGADWIDPRGYEQCNRNIPLYTTSLDAAWTLVELASPAEDLSRPIEIKIAVSKDGKACAQLESWKIGSIGSGQNWRATAALALCIAALKARGLK